MNIGELFIELGFKADTMKLKEFMHAVGELNMSSIAGAVGLGGLYEATKRIMDIADKTAMSIFGYTQVTGLSGKQMQQFSNYAKEMGMSAEDAEGSLKNLQMTMFNVKIGQANPRPFALTGMDPNEKDPIKSLQQLQDYVKATKELDPAIHRWIVNDLGVSESMLLILKASDRITDSINKQPFATDKEINKIVEYHKVLSKLGTDINLLFVRWGASLTPVIVELDKLAVTMLEILRTGEGWKKLFAEIGHIIAKLSPLLNFLKIADVGLKIAEKSIEKNFKFAFSPATNPSAALAGSSGGTVNNYNFEAAISGVQDPEKASDLVTKKLEKLFSDRFYHEKVQER